MKSYSINNTDAGGRRGVTLTELVVVIAILSLLATIMVPMAFNRMEQARIVVAKEECRSIAEAMQTCGAIHGYFVPIRVLDNLRNDIAPADINDDLENEIGIDTYLIKVNKDLDDQLFSAGNQIELGDSGTEKFISEWNGPFLQPQRVYVDEDDDEGDPGFYYDDMPLDPWGNPYRFYCRLGFIGEEEVDNTDSDDWEGAFTGKLVNRNGGATNNIYEGIDRFAIISYGPNGEEDMFDDESDDIIYEFGTEVRIEQMKPFY